MPFSKQFAFIALSHAPLPRAWRCWLLDMWLRHLYWFCMIEHMAPPRASARRFTGQCSDAFFKLTHRVRHFYFYFFSRKKLGCGSALCSSSATCKSLPHSLYNVGARLSARYMRYSSNAYPQADALGSVPPSTLTLSASSMSLWSASPSDSAPWPEQAASLAHPSCSLLRCCR